jgi:hypothetical protein
MRTFNNTQSALVSSLSKSFGFDINLIQPNAIGGTTNSMIKPVDYLKKELKGTGIKLFVNATDNCLVLYV